MKYIGIIPARYASTRFPGKPLIKIDGKTMIQRVYEQALQAMDTVVVATDDLSIETHIKNIGGNVVMTSTEHKSGTDRCCEAAGKIGLEVAEDDVIVNIQGDEPFIKPEQIKELMDCFTDETVQIATLIKQIENSETLFNVSSPKVIIDKDYNAKYFSRAAIPYYRGLEPQRWLQRTRYFKHIGIYGYRYKTLQEITQLPQSNLEIAESLEQLRWLENGYQIKTGLTQHETIAIDTPEDLEKLGY